MNYHIRVPATSANLGPGFDCLGMALELYFHLWAKPANQWRLELDGEGSADLDCSEDNLIVQTYLQTCAKFGWAPTCFQLRCDNHVPVCRGLGSSSTAIVAGISLAFLHHHEMDRQRIFEFANYVEGHPDNVGPAIFGGVQFLDLAKENAVLTALELHPAIRMCVVVPDFHVSTDAMRTGLPEISPAESAKNQALLSGLIQGLAAFDAELLRNSEKDLRHQPFRLQNQPQTHKLFQAMQKSGLGSGVFLSGSGPSVGMWVNSTFQVKNLEPILLPLGIAHRVHFLAPDLEGVFYESVSDS